MFSVPHTPGSPGFGDESGMTLVSPSQRDIKPSLAELEAMSPAEIAAVQGKLNLRLGPEYIAQRPSPGGGGKLTYVEGWRIIMLANEVFGYNGWSSSIVKLETDFCDVNEEYGTRRVSCGISAMVRVTLKDGTYHEDVGYGTADNLKSKGAALDKAKKEAVTDGVKRALRNFGNLLGLCLYEKQFTQEIIKIKAQPRKLDPSELYRNAANTPAPGASSPQPMAGPSAPPQQQYQQQQPQQARQDVKPKPSNMRSVIQAAVKAGPDYKGKAPATPSPLNPTRNTGLNTPSYTPAAPAGQQRPPSRAMPPQQPDRASPFAAPPPRPTTAQPITPLAAPPQPAQPEQRALPARVPSPPRRGPSPPPAKPEPVEEADSLDSFFNSEDDAMFAAYDGEGVESPVAAPAPVQKQQPSRTHSQSSASGRPPSQSAGGFRFPQGAQQQQGGRPSTLSNAGQARPPTSTGNNTARAPMANAGNGAQRPHATNGNWRQHIHSAGTVTGAPVVAGVKRSADAMNVPAKRPINGQGMGLAHQNQRQQPTNLELGAGGDPKRMRR